MLSLGLLAVGYTHLPFASISLGDVVAERVAAYVDGFNLYFGLKSRGWRRFYWLDVAALCRRLLTPTQSLVRTRYFTARVSSPADKVKRQSTYLEALEAQGTCSLHFGQYLDTPRTCPYCGATDTVPKEKMTDILIGLEMLADGLKDECDTFLLVSGDSDLLAPVLKIRELLPAKRVVVAFPPRRQSRALQAAADGSFVIGRKKLLDSQLPERVIKHDDHVLERPVHWT